MPKQHGRDRGAALVEYALIVSLLVVVCIATITSISDSGDEELAASGDRAGSSEDNAYYPGAPTTSTTTATSSTTTTSLPGQQIQPSSLAKAPAPTSSQGNKWIANATVTVTTTVAPITGIAGLLVTGTWDDSNGPTEEASCTTTASGSCPLQLTDINDNNPSAVFTITSITGPGFFWTPGPGDVTTITVGCSPPLDSDCD